jgi:hypothetical protein
VDLQETFETDFRPISQDSIVTPIMLILILDLYFRLTPITMVEETPEIQQLSRLIKISTKEIVQIMTVFQYYDPYLNRKAIPTSALSDACQKIWQRYGNSDTEQLASYASQLKEYFK